MWPVELTARPLILVRSAAGYTASGTTCEGGHSMTRQRRLILASILVAWVGMVLACGGGGRTSHPSQKTGTTEKTIPYEVLKKENRRGDSKLFLEKSRSASRRQNKRL